MSASGQKQTFALQKGMSALSSEANIGSYGFRLTQTLAACHISSGRRVVW
jgi:hypothetical protein